MSAETAHQLALLAWVVAGLAVVVAGYQTVRAHRLAVAHTAALALALRISQQAMALRVRAAAQVASLSATRRRP